MEDLEEPPKNRETFETSQNFISSPMHENLFSQSFAVWSIRVKLIPKILPLFYFAKVASCKNDTNPKMTVYVLGNGSFCGSRILHAKGIPDDRAATCVR